jgi:endonuclease/exonuclease/phosphatase family metal-dependent hydrolase
MDFTNELDQVVTKWQGPTMICGDFNLIRGIKEKSNGVVNWNHVNGFNDWIHRWGLIELSDPTRTFSWTNNQGSPILAKLDRMLVSSDWDSKCPTSQVNMLPKEVSDHNPLRITFCVKKQIKDPIFRFEKLWLEIEEFSEVVQKAWGIECPSTGRFGSSK